VKYSITTDDMLILRDGRPFGESGVFGGSAVNWPFPQTISGMVRTATGFARSADFFNTPGNAEKLLDIEISGILPMLETETGLKPLMPTPADMILTEKVAGNYENFVVNTLSFNSIDKRSGTDLPNRDWLIPSVDLREKPTRKKPFLLHWSFLDSYLKKGIENGSEFTFEEMGIPEPIRNFRMHNAIDGSTHTTEESRLFANNGFYLKTFTRANNRSLSGLVNISINFTVTDKDSETNIVGDAYLGGERKRVYISETEAYFPKFPGYFKEKQYLKIILVTHGDFGGWCPEWLMPDLDKNTIDWVTIPGTEFCIRLRTACISGWDAVSGWDYVKRKPKPMKKLVRPGSVYIIEVKNSDESEKIAQFFWGHTLNFMDSESRKNGYGLSMTGNVVVNNMAEGE